MKLKNIRCRSLFLGSIMVVMAAAPSHLASAATISKSDNTENLNLPASWSGGIVPGAINTASWNALVTGPSSAALGGNLSFRGLEVLNPGGPVTIAAGNVLTLASGGINMSAATQNLTISSGLTLASGGQVWNVATGRALTLNTGTFTRTAGASLNLQGTGTVTAGMTGFVNVNGILGPWATVTRDGVSLGANSAGDTYATISSGGLLPYTTATQLTTAGAWGGMPSGGTPTINYDLTSSATFGAFGVARFANTVRYTGPGAARQPGNTDNADLFTMNGFMNSGAGTFTFGTAGNVANDRPYNVLIGPNRDLVLSAMSGGITFLNPIKNSTAGASAVTVSGRNTVTLSGVNAYTGLTTVGGGTLLVNNAGAINTSSGIQIRGADAKFLHTSSVALTPPITLTRGNLDGTGTLGAVTVGNGSGGVISHGNGGTGTLRMSSLSFEGSATVNASLNGTNVPVAVTGALSTTPANGPVTINIAATPLANGLYNIITAGSFTGSATDFVANISSGLNTRQSAALVLNGTNVALQVNGDTPKWTGALSGNWTIDTFSTTKNWKLATSGTATDFLEGDNVLFDDSAIGVTDVDLGDGDIGAGIIEFNNSVKNYTLSSSIAAYIKSGSIVKNGTAGLTINNANTYVGGTTFNGGTLNLNNDAAIGSGTFTIGAGSAKTLNNTSGVPVVFLSNPAQVWNDDFTFGGASDLDLASGPVTLGGAGADRVVTISSGVLTVGEVKGALHGLTKQGSGTLVLTSSGAGANASTLGGTLNVTAGTLQINRLGSAGTGSGDLTVTGLSGNGTITNGANDERWFLVNTAGSHTFSGTLANGGTGGLGFNKLGTGTVTLDGTLSYTGATTVGGGSLTISVPNSGPGTNATVNSGTLVLAHPSALGTTSLIRTAGNALSTVNIATDGGSNLYNLTFGSGTISTLVSNRATPGDGINHSLATIEGSGVGGGTVNVTSGANVTGGSARISINPLLLGAGSVQTTIFNPTTANVTLGNVAKSVQLLPQTLELGGTSTDNHITGLISDGTAVVSLTKSNSSTWTISGANNTYTGNTLVGTANGAGVLRVTATQALGTGTIVFDNSGGAPGPSSRLELSNNISLPNNITLSQRSNTSANIINVDGDNALNGVIDVNTGGSQARIQSDAGHLSLTGAITTTAGTNRTLYLAGAGNGTASGVISNNPGDPAVVVNLFKEGSGTWTLSGTNTFTGTTTVNAGTLVISGDSSAATGSVIVATDATLAGKGAIGGSVAIGSGGRLAISVADAPANQFSRQIGGALDLSAVGDVLDLTAAVTPADGTYTLVTATGGITGHSNGKLDDSVVNLSGLSGKLSVVGNNLVLTVGGAVSAYETWASDLGLNPSGDGAANADKDGDGASNGVEFILGGSPISGASRANIHSLIADSSADEDASKELVLTIAVPAGTPAFSAGSPTSSATFEGFGITVRGSTDLSSFPVVVDPVNPVTTGLPAAPVIGGTTYEYRSFSLRGSNGTVGKGFLQVTVTAP